jgi:hypothetical protein
VILGRLAIDGRVAMAIIARLNLFFGSCNYNERDARIGLRASASGTVIRYVGSGGLMRRLAPVASPTHPRAGTGSRR